MPALLYYIKSEFNGRVIDVDKQSIKDSAHIVVNNQEKTKDPRHQLWHFQDGYLINAKSAKALDIRGGEMKSGSNIVQYAQKSPQEAANQRWGMTGDGYIYCLARPDLVLDIKGGKDDDDVPVILYEKREGNAASNQRWILEPYQS